MFRRRHTVGLVTVGGLLLCVLGCATQSDLDAAKQNILAQLAQNKKQQDEQVKLLEARVAKLEATGKLLDERTANLDREVKRITQELESIARLPKELEAEVAALRTYTREVEKNIMALRELVARQLDVQNAHIAKIKTAYDDVLKDQGTMVETLTKTLDDALAKLKATIEASRKTLGEKIPAAEDTIPLPPQLRPEIKKGGAPKP